MASLADLIYSSSRNQPNLAQSFQSAKGRAIQQAGMEQQLAANQQARQRQSALQGLLSSGAGAEEVFRQDPATGLQMAEFQKLRGEGASGVDVPEFLKEERKTAAQDVRSFNKSAKEMRTSYGQLSGLADQARGGDRGARNAMTVTLSRLISPGIVTEAEAKGLSGGQEIMQYVLQRVSTGNAEADNLLKGIDPYGEGFDADAMLQIGNSVVASGRQPLIDMYEGSRERATRARMSDRAFETNFGSNPNYDFLTAFQPETTSPTAPRSRAQPQAAPQQPAQTNVDTEALNWARQNPNDPRAAEIMRLQGN